jgi:hypothetical protein
MSADAKREQIDLPLTYGAISRRDQRLSDDYGSVFIIDDLVLDDSIRTDGFRGKSAEVWLCELICPAHTAQRHHLRFNNFTAGRER